MSKKSVWIVRYRLAGPDSPVWPWKCEAYDAEHAQELFCDANEALDWNAGDIVSIRRARPVD
jgi:hypothetical protein